MENQFEDIRPYNDLEIHDVLKRIARTRWLVSGLRRLVFPNCLPFLELAADRLVESYLVLKVHGIRTVDDFQKEIIVGKVLEWLVRHKTDGVTFSGLDALPRDEPHIYMSNHRDIVLDSALLNYVLANNDYPIAYIAFGDNLMVNEFVTDLIRVNKSFIVKRGLPIREQIHASYQLSRYIWHLNRSGGSIWLAQREGRAKNGDDRTNPAVIKMLYLSQRKGGLPFSEVINTLKIVPTAVSYEFDPCDVLKARELQRKESGGVYEKRKRDDLMSMYLGLKEQKGRFDIAFAPPVTGHFENERQVAEQIDRDIHGIMKAWPSNYVAYDQLHPGGRFADRYTAEYRETFLGRYAAESEAVKKRALAMYAKSVENRLALADTREDG